MPVAALITGLRLMTLCAVIVYVGSEVASLCTRARLSVASWMEAPAGNWDRSNFIRIALAIWFSGHVYVVSISSVLLLLVSRLSDVSVGKIVIAPFRTFTPTAPEVATLPWLSRAIAVSV